MQFRIGKQLYDAFHNLRATRIQHLKYYYRQRETSCKVVLQTDPEHALLITGDEAYFHLCGAVNKHNFRYWAEQNPRQVQEKPLHNPKVTVWSTA